jgi:hypothetical protein
LNKALDVTSVLIVKVIKAVGNASNAAVCASRLGLKSAIITDIGDDESGRECLRELEANDVLTSYVHKHKGKATNYHFVLWYGDDRTILVNHIPYDYVLPSFPEPTWLYITSLGSSLNDYYFKIETFSMQKFSEIFIHFFDARNEFVANVVTTNVSVAVGLRVGLGVGVKDGVGVGVSEGVAIGVGESVTICTGCLSDDRLCLRALLLLGNNQRLGNRNSHL